MDEVKALTQSKTFWGAVVAILAALASIGHYSISSADQASLAELLTSLATIAGSLCAIYGRVVASKMIGSVA
jgi:hypothetical protein